jgi:streptomycin 3"-adenylyltransferase
MKRKSFAKAPCPVARALDTIGDWWTLLIIRDAFDGISRFSEFQKNLGIAKNILTERLNHLSSEGIFEITDASDGSAYQEYVLTEKGQKLFYVIVSLRQWGEDHLFKSSEKHSVLLDTETQRPIPRMELRTKAGKHLTHKNTAVKKLA